MPILKKAQEAVKKINKDQITELKAFKSPSALVKLVMESCCLLFGEKEDWPSAQKLLG
jgi:dynein heavy chain